MVSWTTITVILEVVILWTSLLMKIIILVGSLSSLNFTTRTKWYRLTSYKLILLSCFIKT